MRLLGSMLVLTVFLAVSGASAVLAQEPEGPGGRAAYVGMIRRAAVERDVPPDLAEAVAHIESGYDPRAVGTSGEVGLMQVRHGTAEMLGFKGTVAELTQPSENVRYGVTYLAGAWKLAGGDVCRALTKYRAGHNTNAMTPLSVTYCQRARSYLAGLHSPLADGSGPVAAVAPSRVGPPSLARIPTCQRGTPACSKLYWEAHEARVRRIVAQLHAFRRPRG